MTCPDMVAYYRASDMMILCARHQEVACKLRETFITFDEAGKALLDFAEALRKAREEQETTDDDR
jgi:hypothetical protein